MNSDQELYQKTLKQYDDPAYAQKYAANIEGLLDAWMFEDFLNLLEVDSYLLDVGCAAGRDSAYLASKGHRVVGIDSSSELIKIAKEKHPEINFVQGDFLELPFQSATFNAIWAKAALVHMPSMGAVREAISEFYRVLKPKGLIMVFTKTYKKGAPETAVIANKLSGQKRYFRYQDKQQFISLCENTGFKVLESKIYNEQEQKFGANRDENWLLLIAQKPGQNWGEL